MVLCVGVSGNQNKMADGLHAVGIGPYTDDEPWDSYVERLDMYFEACGVTDETKQRGIFLTSVGKQTYQLIKNTWNMVNFRKTKVTKNWLIWNIKILYIYIYICTYVGSISTPLFYWYDNNQFLHQFAQPI